MDAAGAESGSIPYRLLRRVIDVRPAEARALMWSWLYIFAVLCSYYVLRPIRDQAGVAGGVNNLPWLFTGTLLSILALNLPFAWLVRTMPRSRFIPLTYRFFALNILLFAVAQHVFDGNAAVWVGRVFYIWTSVFNLFVVSVFWALVVDLFSTEQGKRLFGFIAAGATLGATAGSAVTSLLATRVPFAVLLVCAAVLLELAVFCVRRLSRLSTALSMPQGGGRDAAEAPRAGSGGGAGRPAGETALGGGTLAGIAHALRSPYLLNVSLFLLVFAVTSTFLYFQQAAIVRDSFTTRQAQTEFFANVDLAVNLLTLVIQVFLTGRILRGLGVAATLALLPGFSILGFGALAAAPALSAIVGVQVLRRAGNFAIARPTREVLFTVLPREDRYKAKTFIDTVVYRLGDQIGAWSYAFLTVTLGWSARGVALVAVPLSAIWLLNAVWLGRRQDRMAAERAALAKS